MHNSSAQEPLYKKYTQENGFPSVKTFQIIQDSQRFIWVCTNNGVCRFDGRHVKSFNPQNSLADYGTFHFFPDSKGRIWVISAFSGPVYFQDELFHEPKGIDQGLINDTRWITEDSKGNLFFLKKSGDIIKWNENAYSSLKITNEVLTGGELVNDSIMIVVSGTNIYRVANFCKIELLKIKGFPFDFSRVYKIKNDLVIGACKEGLYQFRAKESKMIWKYSKEFSSTTCCFYKENDSTFWIGACDGAYIFKYKNERLIFTRKLLNGKIINSIFKDTDGNYWIASANDAIYFINSGYATLYNLPGKENNISQILFTAQSGYVFDFHGYFYKIKKEHLENEGSIVSKSGSFFLKAVNYFDNEILIRYARGDKYYMVKDGKAAPFNNILGLSYASFYNRKDKILFAVGHTIDGKVCFKKLANNSIITTAIFNTGLNFSKNFCVDFNDRIWTGIKDTIYCITNGGVGNQAIQKICKAGIYISDIQCDADNKIWVSTNGSGVLCIKDFKIISEFNANNGLITNNCSSLYIDDDNNVWVCSENGLNKIYQKGNSHDIIRTYTKNNLLPEGAVNCVYKKDNMVYVGTSNGLVVFEDKNKEIYEPPLSCYITGIAIGGKENAVTDHYELEYGKSISIAFSSVGYNSEKPPVYHYKMEGADEEWNSTGFEKIQYDHLNPGKYTFIVFADKWNNKSRSLLLLIYPPFWEKWWFILLEIVTGFLVVFFISYRIIRSKNKKNEFKRRVIENDLKSLRAQINPHFIFNALNSIQDYILDQQPRFANYYLTRFAKLMRMIIDNSRMESISLANEIDFLKLYLELEQLRLGDSFEFEIIADKNTDTQMIFIPPMIIQPIIENSIKHGLSAKKGSKVLQMYFSEQGKLLHCVITDNGIGRKRAREYDNEKTIKTSMGIENITERLELLYVKQNIKGQCIRITDLYDSNEIASGTKVELLIPVFPTQLF